MQEGGPAHARVPAWHGHPACPSPRSREPSSGRPLGWWVLCLGVEAVSFPRGGPGASLPSAPPRRLVGNGRGGPGPWATGAVLAGWPGPRPAQPHLPGLQSRGSALGSWGLVGCTVAPWRRSRVGFLPLPRPSGSSLLSPEVAVGRKVPPAFTITLPWHPQAGWWQRPLLRGPAPAPAWPGRQATRSASLCRGAGAATWPTCRAQWPLGRGGRALALGSPALRGFWSAVGSV